MNRRKQKQILRILTLFAVCMTVLSVVFSFYCSLELFHHDCCGDDCPICRFIYVCRASFRFSAAGIVLIVGLLLFILFTKKKTSVFTARNIFTPVFLAVRMNN